MRVLFVGSMTQRKGLGDLFAAVRHFSPTEVTLTVMGPLAAPIDFYRKELPNFVYIPPASNDRVLETMDDHDIFCLPSVVEGRATVVLEAASRGLPVIITSATGCSDLFDHGNCGALLEKCDAELIAKSLASFLADRSQLNRCGEQARAAASRFTWGKYVDRLAARLPVEHLSGLPSVDAMSGMSR